MKYAGAISMAILMLAAMFSGCEKEVIKEVIYNGKKYNIDIEQLIKRYNEKMERGFE